MRKTLPLIVLFALAGSAVPGYAQDNADADGEEDTAAADDAASGQTAAGADSGESDEDSVDLDDPAFAGLDSQDYETDDDDFIPTEEVPADQAIPFPSDI